MNAAASRAALAAVGADLVALSGAPAERRGAALLMRLVEAPSAEASIQDLRTVPDWLRQPKEAQRRVALRLALLSMAPALARSIDGRWLGEVAALVGEDVVDWAMDAAGSIDGADNAPIAADAIEGRGFAFLRGQLPDALKGYLGWAPSGEASVERAIVTPWLDRALAAEAA